MLAEKVLEDDDVAMWLLEEVLGTTLDCVLEVTLVAKPELDEMVTLLLRELDKGIEYMLEDELGVTVEELLEVTLVLLLVELLGAVE